MTEIFEKKVSIEKLSDSPTRARLEATQEQCAAITNRLNIVGVQSLKGFIEVTRSKKLIFAKGNVDALLTRQCVISLEGMDEVVSEGFDLRFDPTPLEFAPGSELEVDDDMPEPLEGPEIDLANILVEQVALAMSEYPRKEGAEALKDLGDQPEISPFAILKSHNLNEDKN